MLTSIDLFERLKNFVLSLLFQPWIGYCTLTALMVDFWVEWMLICWILVIAVYDCCWLELLKLLWIIVAHLNGWYCCELLLLGWMVWMGVAGLNGLNGSCWFEWELLGWMVWMGVAGLNGLNGSCWFEWFEWELLGWMVWMGVAGLNGCSWYTFGLLIGMPVKSCGLCCVCGFYLSCIVIPKHFNWLPTNIASIPTCIVSCFEKVLLLFYTAKSSALNLEG
jgi:hypothetical protein